jgi:hypothetical protein
MTWRTRFITQKKNRCTYFVSSIFYLLPENFPCIFIMDSIYASDMLWINSSARCMRSVSVAKLLVHILA